jgi:GTP cyclohydrolase II
MTAAVTTRLAPETAAMMAVNRAVADLRRGSFVVIEGEAETALAQAAESVTPDSLAALSDLSSGRPRLALTAARARVLNFPASTAAVVVLPLTAGVDAPTVRYLVDPTCQPPAGPLVLPQPIALQDADEGSCASAAIGLSKLAQLLPAAVTAPLTGRLLEQLDQIAANRHLLRVEAGAVAAYPRLAAETLRPVSEARLPLAAAENGRIVGFRPADGSAEQFAIVIGDPAAHQPALCRLHSECFTGDLLGSLRCDCGPQLNRALQLMGKAGHGVLLYLAHEGRGIGLINKLRAYRLQDQGLDTVDANHYLGFESDERSFRAAATMLRHLGIERIRLLTNNPAKVEALRREGVEIVERVGHAIPANQHNRAYLATKASRSGHLFES